MVKYTCRVFYFTLRNIIVCLILQLSMEKVQAMAEQVEIKAKVVQTEVKALVLRHKKALEERECELLWKVSRSIPAHYCLLFPVSTASEPRPSHVTATYAEQIDCCQSSSKIFNKSRPLYLGFQYWVWYTQNKSDTASPCTHITHMSEVHLQFLSSLYHDSV